jgi:hypothetical protein
MAYVCLLDTDFGTWPASGTTNDRSALEPSHDAVMGK